MKKKGEDKGKEGITKQAVESLTEEPIHHVSNSQIPIKMHSKCATLQHKWLLWSDLSVWPKWGVALLENQIKETGPACGKANGQDTRQI